MWDNFVDYTDMRKTQNPIRSHWTCPHEKYEDHELCIFHLPYQGINPPTEDVKEEFINKVKNGDKREKEFIGAVFSELDLSYINLESNNNHPIDLRCARIDSKLDISELYTGQKFIIDLSVIDDLRGMDATILNDISVQGSVICGSVNISTSQIKGNCNFSHTEFRKKIRAGKILVENNIDFSNVDIKEGASFRHSEFRGDAKFNQGIFDGGVSFRGMECHSDLDFAGAVFRATTEQEVTSFKDAIFGGKSTFSGTEFNNDADFIGSEVNGRIEFNRSTFNEQEDRPAIIDLSDAKLNSGQIIFPGEKAPLYILTEATIGDIKLGTHDHNLSIFDRLHINMTDFDGFDFTKYREELEPNWNLHNFEGYNVEIEPVPNITVQNSSMNYERQGEGVVSGATEGVLAGDASFGPDLTISDIEVESYGREALFIDNPSHSDLETIYLKARNGARKIGDQESASEFSIRQMRERRARYLDRLKNNKDSDNNDICDNIRLQYKRIANWLLDKTTIYGEHPLRVGWISLLAIVVFTFLYPLTKGISNQETNNTLQYSLSGSPLKMWDSLFLV